jgi:hypothetical protein
MSKPQVDTSFRPLIGRTGSPRVPTKNDPDKLRGYDLSKILTVQETARVSKIRGFTLRRQTPQLVAEGGTYPQVVTFRTVIPSPFVQGRRILISRFETDPDVGDFTVANVIILTTDYCDEISFVVAPGERWWAAMGQAAGADILTVITKEISLLK